MSAKGRGAESIAHDNYPTPLWCVERLLEALPHLRTCGGAWLEPACGDGAIVRAVGGLQCRRWVQWDITHDTMRLSHGDYLQQPAPYVPYAVAITNPPFTLAFEFMRKMLYEAEEVLLLGRLDMLGSGKRSGRSAWLREHTPSVYVLPDRPCFAHKVTRVAETLRLPAPTPMMIPWNAPTPAGYGKRRATTDATEYAWFHWFRGGSYPAPQLRILDETPVSERVDRIVQR